MESSSSTAGACTMEVPASALGSAAGSQSSTVVPFPRCAPQHERSARLMGQRLNHRQSQTRAFADPLCREKRLHGARQRRLIHALHRYP